MVEEEDYRILREENESLREENRRLRNKLYEALELGNLDT